ncbi:MAG: secretin and TonB N-terminal domain-containing protein [Fimbriimonadia bacterium]|jgi:hypothetical protein
MGIALLLAVAVWGQTPGSVTVEGEGVPVRQVLDSLFQQAGLQYVLDPAVQGDVTVKVKDVPFETALRLVLRQLRLTYSVEGGVYVIGPAPAEPPPIIQAPEEPNLAPGERLVKIKVHNVPASVVLMMLMGYRRDTWLGPMNRPPDGYIFGGGRWMMYGAQGFLGWMGYGAFLPVWTGGGWPGR